MIGKAPPRGDLIPFAQRVLNLSYVLALNPFHSGALAALKTLVESPDADAVLGEVLQDIRRLTNASITRANVAELTACAERVYGIVVAESVATLTGERV